MSDRRVPVAVIGAGNMGSNHIRVLNELSCAELLEVVEPDPERAADIQEKYDVTVLEEVSGITEADAVTVAVPNHFHRQVAEKCLTSGLDVFVEKPLATNEDDAVSIVETARENDAILQVGHIERFNPAIETLETILEDQEIIALESHRLGPFNEHLSTESVIKDLMIHDLDIFNSIVTSSVRSINSFGVAARSETIDHAVAQLQFENGVMGTLTASHVTHGKVRTLSVITHESYITLDYQKQNITVQQAGTERTTKILEKSGYRTETITESPYVQTREPLKNELGHFITCIKERKNPRVDGENGINAVRLAMSVIENANTYGGTCS